MSIIRMGAILLHTQLLMLIALARQLAYCWVTADIKQAYNAGLITEDEWYEAERTWGRKGTDAARDFVTGIFLKNAVKEAAKSISIGSKNNSGPSAPEEDLWGDASDSSDRSIGSADIEGRASAPKASGDAIMNTVKTDTKKTKYVGQ